VFVGLATIFVSAILFINFIKYANCYLDTNSRICMMKDNDNIAKGVLEANNIKVNNVDAAMAHIRDGAVYIGGMAAAAKILKNSSLPIGAKLGTVIGMGATSLIGYRLTSNSLSKDRTHSSMNIEVEKINSSIGLSKKPSSDKTAINKFLPDSSASSQHSNDVSSEGESFNISPLDLEQLQLEFYLHIAIVYLLVIALVFLLMKSLSSMNFKFEFLNNIPFLQKLLLKLMH